MALKFGMSGQAGFSHGIKTLVYGPAGFGKTRLGATAPTPLFLSAESGLLSIRRENVPFLQIDNLADLNDAYNFILSSQDAKHFETICLDSITEIAEQVLAYAKGKTKDPRQAYGELLEEMTIQIKKFRDLPNRHVYISAKQEQFKDEGTGYLLYGPSMPGSKLGPALPYLFDEVFRLGTAKEPATQKEYSFLQTKADLQYNAKDRSGSLDAIEPPDLKHVFNKILQGA